MSVKCIYCKKPCILLNDAVHRLSDAQPRKCESCQVYHWITRNGIFLYVTWAPVTINNQRYMVKAYPPWTTNRGARFIIYHKVSKANGDASWQEVKRLDFIPDWQPLSAERKIKTVLTFL